MVVLAAGISPLVLGGAGVVLCASVGLTGDSDHHYKYMPGFVVENPSCISLLLKALFQRLPRQSSGQDSAFTAEGMGLTLDLGTKIPHATRNTQ